MQSVGGYRRIRTLAEGESGEVFLARAEGTSDPPVVVRLTDDARAEAEIAALTAAAGAHVIELLDLFTAPDDRIGVVVPRLPGGSLGQLLERRGMLRAGEATTVLVAVCRGLAALHRSGRTHGALGVSRVRFAEDGTPLLIGLGLSAPVTAEGEAADRAALARLARAVLARTEGGAAALAKVGGDVEPDRLEELLFDAADPLPVDLDGEPVPHEPAVPSRIDGSAPVLGATPPRAARLQSLRRLRSGAGKTVAGVRPRFWIAAALAAAALGAALVLTPDGQPESSATPGEAPDPSASTSPPLPAIERAVLAADDPVEAAVALAAARDGCRAAGSAECLGTVLEPGSALLETDVAALGSAGEPTVTGTVEEATVQRTGDAAMVGFPAGTLLLLRVEGEWRLRDVFAAEPPSG